MDARGSQFNPNAFPDVPLYNIQAVASATGVPSITLRSWERRYGVPEPKRDDKGYRLYSERDMAVTRWLRERVHEGMGISRAVNLLHILEQDQPPAVETAGLDFDSLRQKLLVAVDRMDEGAVSRVIAESLMVASIEQVGIHLLQPALYEVGERWAVGKLSVTTEHISSNLVRSHLVQWARISPPPLREERVMVGCSPGELHDIGALMLAVFLRRRGFDVIFCGANVEFDSFMADVLRMDPDAVCLSAATPQSARSLRELFEALEGRFRGVLAFGGRAFNENDNLRQALPGMYLGADGVTATANLEAALRGRSAA